MEAAAVTKKLMDRYERVKHKVPARRIEHVNRMIRYGDGPGLREALRDILAIYDRLPHHPYPFINHQ